MGNEVQQFKTENDKLIQNLDQCKTENEKLTLKFDQQSNYIERMENKLQELGISEGDFSGLEAAVRDIHSEGKSNEGIVVARKDVDQMLLEAAETGMFDKRGNSGPNEA